MMIRNEAEMTKIEIPEQGKQKFVLDIGFYRMRGSIIFIFSREGTMYSYLDCANNKIWTSNLGIIEGPAYPNVVEDPPPIYPIDNMDGQTIRGILHFAGSRITEIKEETERYIKLEHQLSEVYSNLHPEK